MLQTLCKHPARKARGLHLPEMLVVLMILCVLLAVAWRPWQRAMRQLQAESLRAQLVGSLSLARSTAITEGRPVTVCGSGDGSRCDNRWSQGWRVQVEPRVASGGMTTLLHTLENRNRHVELRASDHRAHIRFRADGRNAGTNQSIVLCVQGLEHSRVIINIPGRIRSLRPRVPTPC
ncbi:GspH/FimT family pseudopilin [Stenotrophomonas maltophilia]|uniref:GspH/FimT family pseudopilin n=1 Tax=Stenotrophomonas maltophilia TaxID=40324 RepID=UPI0034D4280D